MQVFCQLRAGGTDLAAHGLCGSASHPQEQLIRGVEGWRDFLRWLCSRERLALLALLALAGGAWGFAKLALDVAEGETRSIDTRLLLLLRKPGDTADPIGPYWLESVARDVTALGGAAVLVFVTLAACGFLALQRRVRLASYLLAAVGSGMAANAVLKIGFARPRPELVPHGQVVYSSSFPSGHSMMSAIVYLTLGALLASSQPRRVLKAYLIFLSMLLTLSIGVSRVYLAVHWPTDVLAGWMAGAAWALASWSLAHWLRSRTAP